MKGDSEVAALVADSVDAKFVCHICHRILLVCSFRDDLHWLFFAAFWEGVADLSEIAFQNLHQAMRIAVIVDGASLAWRPDKHKLCGVSHDTT